VSSWELADVLGRRKLARYRLGSDEIAVALAFLRETLPTVEVEVDVRDPDDVPLVEAALAGRADAIVTGDRHVRDDSELCGWLADRGVSVLLPAELLKRPAERRLSRQRARQAANTANVASP
jgi:predicted nucleic acid-binding protein